MIGLLTKNGFQVIVHQYGEGPDAFAAKLLGAMGVGTESGLKVLASSRPENRNISLTFPGVVFNLGSRQMLLTPTGVPDSLTSVLTENNLQVVKYSVYDPS